MAKAKKRRRVNIDDETDEDELLGHESKLVTSQVVEQVTKAPCSIEFSRDAKGQPRWAIKLYGEESDMDQVVKRIAELDTQLRKATR